MSTTPVQVLANALPIIEVSMVESRLVRDYLAGAPALASFFSGHPRDADAFRRKAAEVDRRLDAAARGRVAAAFRPLSENAVRKLARILAGDGYMVTTGQQTGLFTGPLYTVHKALSAMRLAAELETLLDRPVLALFWCAADDHDWAEVNHVSVLDGQRYVQRIGLPDDPDAPAMAMSHRPIPASIGVALDELSAALPRSPWGDACLQRLRAAYRPGRSMAEAFEDALAAVLEGMDVALVSSAHPLVKRHSLPVVRRALVDWAAQERAVAGQTARLEAAGYPAQVAVAEGASNVFLQTEAGRDRLVRDGDAWMLRRARRRFAESELLERLEREPGNFSPNVLLRPVVESSLFPTVAYVGGPAETSYFAQIGCLFLAHGILPPLASPRHSVTLVDPKAAALLERNGLDPRSVRLPFAELVARVVKEELPVEVGAALERLRERVGASFDELAAAASALDPTLAGPLRGARHRALARAADLEKKILHHARLRQASRFEQVRRAAAALYPAAPQERVLNVFPYLAEYGPRLLEAVLRGMAVELNGRYPEYGVTCNDDALAAPEKGGIA
jgi:bacillithiol biosynthesis cysteine-adding enzyme BshC